MTYLERLARLIFILIILGIVASLCYVFRSVLVYIILAAVVALLAHPIFRLLKKVHVNSKAKDGSIKRHVLPDWAGAIISLVLVFAIVVGIVTTIFPVIGSVVGDISTANIENMTQSLSTPLANLNRSLRHTFPALDSDFRIEYVVLEQLQDLLDMSMFSTMIGSVASFIASLAVALFAIIFISFFFIKNPGLITRIVTLLVPEKYGNKVTASMGQIGHLISRYFLGLFLEVLGVSILNFLGLLIVARMGFEYSIGIAFLTGILNVIPYVGPLIGGAIGVSLSLIIKYICATSYGLGVGFLPFVLILVGIFLFTQLVDNYVFQPFIYSNSVKAHPLEIFIVLLMAGHLGGIVGMLAAIPTYTVIRVVAQHFFSDVRAVQALMQTSENKPK